jgi:hypothetical protein
MMIKVRAGGVAVDRGEGRHAKNTQGRGLGRRCPYGEFTVFAGSPADKGAYDAM